VTTDQELQLLRIVASTLVQLAEAVKNAKSGKVDADEVISNVTALHDELEANNAAADASLDSRFPR